MRPQLCSHLIVKHHVSNYMIIPGTRCNLLGLITGHYPASLEDLSFGVLGPRCAAPRDLLLSVALAGWVGQQPPEGEQTNILTL